MGKARESGKHKRLGRQTGVRPMWAAVEQASTATGTSSSASPFSSALQPMCLLQGPSSPYGPPLYRIILACIGLSGMGGRWAFFLLNKDFLIDTLTWPVVFGEGLQRQLLGSPLSPVDPDTDTHSQELDLKQGLLHAFFSVTSFHNLWALGLGWPSPHSYPSLPCYSHERPSSYLLYTIRP